ncbi:hypothetical protein L2E82_30470 [Cichorium intybus]|uniref:Uncharacterized protein n=1 Tax=Cichorium intybus TaxID=13427 RepID=A0ACB9D0T2_CICIN|nr:hypothetical protein L2E82_30470 [Cichorium intybus]
MVPTQSLGRHRYGRQLLFTVFGPLLHLYHAPPHCYGITADVLYRYHGPPDTTTTIKIAVDFESYGVGNEAIDLGKLQFQIQVPFRFPISVLDVHRDTFRFLRRRRSKTLLLTIAIDSLYFEVYIWIYSRCHWLNKTTDNRSFHTRGYSWYR